MNQTDTSNLHPWVYCYRECDGVGCHFYKHPDGRETQHRKFRLGDRCHNWPRPWREIMYTIAEEDAKHAIARDKQKADAQPKKPVVRTSGTMPNGAEIIAQVGVVVLAKYGREYVTWLVDKDLHASAGHYFPAHGPKAAEHVEFCKACDDFIARCNTWHGASH